MKLGLLARLRTVVAVFVAMACSVMCHAAQFPTGGLNAAIQTASGNYLTAVNGGGLGGPNAGPAAVPLHSDATAAGPWETFTIVWLDSTYTQFALKTSDGHYVTAANGGGVGGPNDSSAPIHTDAKRIGIWETLTLNFLPNNQLTIKALNGRFLTAVNGGGMSGPQDSPIRTDTPQPGAWETFTLVKLGAASGDARKGPPKDTGSGQNSPDQASGKCFEESSEESNPHSLFLKWECPPLFDPKTATADIVTRAALDFLTKYAKVWQLENPAKELKRRYAQPNWDVEFRQWNGGVRVFEAEMHLSFMGGVPSWVRSDYVPGLDSLDKSPKLSGAQAIEAARKHEATSNHRALDAIRARGKPMLGISIAEQDEPSRPPCLVYRLELDFGDGHGTECEIDAHTGEVVRERPTGPLSGTPIG